MHHNGWGETQREQHTTGDEVPFAPAVVVSAKPETMSGEGTGIIRPDGTVDRELLEQHKLMALNQARQILKKNTGVDWGNHAMKTTPDHALRQPPSPKLRLPTPQPYTPSGSVLPSPPPTLPLPRPKPNTNFVEQTVTRVLEKDGEEPPSNVPSENDANVTVYRSHPHKNTKMTVYVKTEG
mmetsp:Transcript_27148/g.63061  ORF Transcript_27148/g.63061 Transcript_27148/m.63061 type:complete len:181 (+) Transcript_27148:109-651(+)